MNAKQNKGGFILPFLRGEAGFTKPLFRRFAVRAGVIFQTSFILFPAERQLILYFPVPFLDQFYRNRVPNPAFSGRMKPHGQR